MRMSLLIGALLAGAAWAAAPEAVEPPPNAPATVEWNAQAGRLSLRYHGGLVLDERSLARLATVMGDTAMAARRQKRIEKAVKAMREHMWDEKAGTFLAVNRDSLAKIPVATISSWIPLTDGVPTAAMAKRMVEVLASPAWQTPLPVPTVARTDKRWESSAFWRGDVWLPTNYQIASGLAAYGHKNLAADIADKTIANAIKNGINEHYDSISGKPLGVKDYCMGSTLVTMMLDRIAQKHTLNLRDKSSVP
jgi:neutral trehalase